MRKEEEGEARGTEGGEEEAREEKEGDRLKECKRSKGRIKRWAEKSIRRHERAVERLRLEGWNWRLVIFPTRAWMNDLHVDRFGSAKGWDRR